MTGHPLKQLIARQHDTRALVSRIADALGTPMAIEDGAGRLLHGVAPGPAASRHAVAHEGVGIGWVVGGDQLNVVAALLEHLIGHETERKALGAEVLHLYREVNLIYSFSEKLTALLDLDLVAQLTLQQARHLIVASDGAIMLVDASGGSTPVLATVASFGDALPLDARVDVGKGIVGSVAASGTSPLSR